MNQSVQSIKILSVVGARPNFIKIAPIARTIEEHNSKDCIPTINHLIVHTGQHYDDMMSSRFFEDLELPKPHVNLDVGSATHAVQTAKIMERFEPILLKEQPDVLLIVGDVNSTVACTLVASKIQYNGTAKRLRPIIGHIEAGLRSFDRDMPEEINRILTDALSDLLFITEESARINLEREGIPYEKIHFVGNVMIDTLIKHLEKASTLNTLASIGLKREKLSKGYGVITLHRPSNVDTETTLSSLVKCIENIAKELPLIFSLHPRTRVNLKRFGIYDDLAKNSRIYLTEPLGYLEFLNLLSSATMVLTDSGGIQEETTFLQVPCITLRSNTERPVTVSIGTNYLVGVNPDKILETAFSILNKREKRGTVPPLWDGKAGKRILEILINYLENGGNYSKS
jgi:UDP-N-acetylglucosamine 2-epimerase (non-hydrolysing)